MSAPPAPTDPLAVIRSRQYTRLLVLAGIVGVPVSVAAYGFLKLVDFLQKRLFHTLPGTLGFDHVPAWWPLPLLLIGGLLTAAAVKYLPGTGGHSPADGFKAGG